MDDGQAVFEQLNLSGFKKWSWFHSIKGALSSLRNFLENDRPLKMMKNAFHIKYYSRLNF